MIDTSGKIPAKGNWQRIVWRKVEKMVFRLQKRIYAATKAGQLKFYYIYTAMTSIMQNSQGLSMKNVEIIRI